MITRMQAAQIRYCVRVDNESPHKVAAMYDLTTSAVNRIVEDHLVPPREERVVVPPGYAARSRKLTVEQRVKIAHLLCFGAPLQALAEEYDVRIRSIQHIKEHFTRRRGSGRRSNGPSAGMNNNTAAEIRFMHWVQEVPLAMISAKLFISYKAVYRAAKNKSFVPTHGRRLTTAAKGLDPESQSGRALKLWLYGASEDFISAETDIPEDAVRALVFSSTEPMT